METPPPPLSALTITEAPEETVDETDIFPYLAVRSHKVANYYYGVTDIQGALSFYLTSKKAEKNFFDEPGKLEMFYSLPLDHKKVHVYTPPKSSPSALYGEDQAKIFKPRDDLDIYEFLELQYLPRRLFKRVVVETMRTFINLGRADLAVTVRDSIPAHIFTLDRMALELREVREYLDPNFEKPKKEVGGVLYPEDLISDEEVKEEIKAIAEGRESPRKSSLSPDRTMSKFNATKVIDLS